LELPQRRPLRLADGFAGRLDLDVAHRRAFFFFFTRLGGPAAAGVGVGAAGERFAPSPSSGSSRLGARELRFAGVVGGVFATSRRVISPWPTVQRFVVTQYRTRPVGNRTRIGTNRSGSTIIMFRCDFCIVVPMK